MLSDMSRTLADCGVPHRVGTYFKPPNCKGVFAAQVGSLPGGQDRTLQKIIPDMSIDARSLVTAAAGKGGALLGKKRFCFRVLVLILPQRPDEKKTSPTARYSREEAILAPTPQLPSGEEQRSSGARSAERVTMR